MNDEILTAEDLSKLLKTSSQTIWRWCKSGKIPAFKFGGSWRIRSSDLEKSMNKKIRLILNENEDGKGSKSIPDFS